MRSPQAKRRRAGALITTGLLLGLLTVAQVGPWGGAGARAEEPLAHTIALPLLVRDGLFPSNQDAFITTASVQRVGNQLRVTVSVTSSVGGPTLLDLEVYGPDGKRWFQHWSRTRLVKPGVTETLVGTWTPPLTAPFGTYVVKVGVFGPNWDGLFEQLRHKLCVRGVVARPPSSPRAAIGSPSDRSMLDRAHLGRLRSTYAQ